MCGGVGGGVGDLAFVAGAALLESQDHERAGPAAEEGSAGSAGAAVPLCPIPYSATRAEAEQRRDAFARRYRKAYPKAVAILETDWDRLVAFYKFPEAHWKHLRTTNVVESPFASVRLRTAAAKRFKRVDNATAMIWKLLLVAESRFRRLDAPELLSDVYNGVEFEDGREVSKSSGRVAA